MKKIIILFIITLVAVFLFPHSPTAVNIDYDAVKKLINVEVKHDLKTSPVQDPKKHYIKSIILKINGKTVKTNTFTMQDSIEGQSTVFENIDVEKGNKITVEAICNLIGSKSSSIVIK